MIQHKSVDVVVVSDQPDDAEAVSQTLRNAGVAARCARLARHEDVADSLNGASPQLIFLFAPDGDDPHLPAVIGAREAEERKLALRRFGSKAQEILTLEDALAALPGEALAPDLKRAKSE